MNEQNQEFFFDTEAGQSVEFTGRQPNLKALERLSRLRTHCGELHRLSPPIRIEQELVKKKNESAFCRVFFPGAAVIKNEAFRRHLAALIEEADCFYLEALPDGVRFSFRVDGIWLP